MRHKQQKKLTFVYMKKSSIFTEEKYCLNQLFRWSDNIPGCFESPQQNIFRFLLTKQNKEKSGKNKNNY